MTPQGFDDIAVTRFGDIVSFGALIGLVAVIVAAVPGAVVGGLLGRIFGTQLLTPVGQSIIFAAGAALMIAGTQMLFVGQPAGPWEILVAGAAGAAASLVGLAVFRSLTTRPALG